MLKPKGNKSGAHSGKQSSTGPASKNEGSSVLGPLLPESNPLTGTKKMSEDLQTRMDVSSLQVQPGDEEESRDEISGTDNIFEKRSSISSGSSQGGARGVRVLSTLASPRAGNH